MAAGWPQPDNIRMASSSGTRTAAGKWAGCVCHTSTYHIDDQVPGLQPGRHIVGIFRSRRAKIRRGSSGTWSGSNFRGRLWKSLTSETASFSPDGKILVIAEKYDVTLWDVAARKKVMSLAEARNRPHEDRSWAYHKDTLAFSADGAILAAAGNGKVFYWEMARRQLYWDKPRPELRGSPFKIPYGRRPSIPTCLSWPCPEGSNSGTSAGSEPSARYATI